MFIACYGANNPETRTLLYRYLIPESEKFKPSTITHSMGCCRDGHSFINQCKHVHSKHHQMKQKRCHKSPINRHGYQNNQIKYSTLNI